MFEKVADQGPHTVGTEEQGKVFVKKITSCFIRNY